MTGTACFFNWFLVKKRTKREISGRFSGKTLIIERQFFQNVTVFMIGTSCILDVFLSKKRTKRENSDGLSGETPYNRMTIFTKSNGFLLQVHRVF